MRKKNKYNYLKLIQYYEQIYELIKNVNRTEEKKSTYYIEKRMKRTGQKTKERLHGSGPNTTNQTLPALTLSK